MQAINDELPSCNHRDNTNQIAVHHGSKKGFAPLHPAADAHPNIFRPLEELAASSTIWAAAKLSSVAVNVSTNNLPMLCCTSRSSFSAVPIPLTHTARGSNSAGPCFTSSALTFSLDHSSSCAAARLGLVRGSIVGNNLPLSEKIRTIFRRRC